jgi:hypothetical protein
LNSNHPDQFYHYQQQQQQQLPQLPQLPQQQQQREIPDLNLIAAWEKQEQLKNAPTNGQFHQTQKTLSGVSTATQPYFDLNEFDNFKAPVTSFSEVTSNPNESTWTQEWARQQDVDTDDEEDEFREEWSNENFTQAYINNNQSKFREIEEQDRLREDRLKQEREKQRAASGGPPRPGWMMAGSVSTFTTNVETVNSSQDSRGTAFIDEFLSQNNSSTYPLSPLDRQSHPPPEAIRSEDGSLSLVSDLNLAEQIYYPGASSATAQPGPEEENLARIEATSLEWVQEFSAEDSQRRRQQQQQQKYLGAEWNWEKLFGKDPRRLASSQSDNKDTMDEHERLRTVALARLKSLFGHLSLTSQQEPNSTSSP